MYIFQNGALYIQRADGKLVGVEIYPDHVKEIAGTETKLGKTFQLFTPFEVRAKFHTDVEPYIFPKKPSKTEVIKNDSTSPDIEKPTRKPRGRG